MQFFDQGSQYQDTAGIGVVLTLLIVGFVLYNIKRAKGKKGLFIRRIAGLNALDDAIGRATEMGRPVLMVPGIGDLNAVSVQALSVFAHVTKSAAQFSTPIRLCCGNAAVYTVAQELIKDVYQTQGMSDRFDANSVQFVSDRQFAFAAGVSGIIHREKVAAAFLLGEFYAESLIFAETCNAVGAIQVAGSTQNTQTPFFIAACDYVLIGDEFYAASAYLRRVPELVGSLVGLDWAKIMIASFIVFGTLFQSMELRKSAVGQLVRKPDPEVEGAEVWEPYVVDEDHPKRGMLANSTWVDRLFNPSLNKEQAKIEREKKPEPASPEGTTGDGGDGS
jgi:hypothetical protein